MTCSARRLPERTWEGQRQVDHAQVRESLDRLIAPATAADCPTLVVAPGCHSTAPAGPRGAVTVEPVTGLDGWASDEVTTTPDSPRSPLGRGEAEGYGPGRGMDSDGKAYGRGGTEEGWHITATGKGEGDASDVVFGL